MTTYYAVKDPQGKQCSDARSTEFAAWQELITDTCFTVGPADFKEHGYRIEPVGCYNQETQVVVDRAAYDWACTVVYEDKTINWRHAMCRQFLSAGDKPCLYRGEIA